jgi:hypothetical protein
VSGQRDRRATVEEREQLTELIRQAHAAAKDLRGAIRQARQVAGDLLAGDIQQQITARVHAELEVLAEQATGAADRTQQLIEKRLTRVFGALLGVPGVRSLDALIAELDRRAAAGRADPDEGRAAVRRLMGIDR